MNLLRTQRHEPVKARAKTFHRFAGQAHDQVRVDVNARLRAQVAEVILQPGVVLPPLDQLAGLFIERLDADLELQRAGREFRDDFTQRGGQAIGHHLEMEKQAGLPALQEKLQQRPAHQQVQVERAVHEFELLHPTREQPLQFRQHLLQRKLPHRNVER